MKKKRKYRRNRVRRPSKYRTRKAPRGYRRRRNPGGWNDIRPGDTVVFLKYVGGGSRHPEYKQKSGRVVMRNSHGGWVLNAGGAHGTPALVDQKNFVRIAKKAKNKT